MKIPLRAALPPRAALTAASLILVLCLLLASCESLMDPRAWGNGSGRGMAATEPGPASRAARGGSASSKSGAEKPAAKNESSAAKADNPPAKAAEPSSVKAANPQPAQAPAAERGPGSLARTVSAGEGPGALVLRAAIARVDGGKAFKGSCYDFASAVFADAGFPPAKVKKVFSGKAAGPFADPALFQPGDWLYITHVYSATLDHSLIFVAWLDFGERIALTIDYPGDNRLEPGRYRVADLYKVWGVNRAAR